MTRLVPLLSLALIASASAQQPLHQRIDALIESGAPNYSKLAAPNADDAEFLRRIYIDLNGTIPTVAQAKAFLEDKSPDKRAKVIDTLLASPEFARHFAQVLDVMLM